MALSISKSQMASIMKSSYAEGAIMLITFTKRTDGSERHMICVRNDDTSGMLYNPEDYNLMSVEDREKADYRMINLDGLKSGNINGVSYEVK